MGRTVGELLDSMSGAELAHWFAYYEVDPWTEDRADWRSGMVCSVIANCLTGSKHGPDDFTPKFKPAGQHADEDDEDADKRLMLQGMKWAGMLGGTLTKA